MGSDLKQRRAIILSASGAVVGAASMMFLHPVSNVVEFAEGLVVGLCLAMAIGLTIKAGRRS